MLFSCRKLFSDLHAIICLKSLALDLKLPKYLCYKTKFGSNEQRMELHHRQEIFKYIEITTSLNILIIKLFLFVNF